LFCFAALQITAAAGNRLAHPLFSELSRLGKRFHKSEITQIPPITLSGIVKVSHLLRPIRPGFMFSVSGTDNSGASETAWRAKAFLRLRHLFPLLQIHSKNLRIHLEAIALTTPTDYRLVWSLPRQQPNPPQPHPMAPFGI
jgi:hypothetical protein